MAASFRLIAILSALLSSALAIPHTRSDDAGFVAGELESPDDFREFAASESFGSRFTAAAVGSGKQRSSGGGEDLESGSPGARRGSSWSAPETESNRRPSRITRWPATAPPSKAPTMDTAASNSREEKLRTQKFKNFKTNKPTASRSQETERKEPGSESREVKLQESVKQERIRTQEIQNRRKLNSGKLAKHGKDDESQGKFISFDLIAKLAEEQRMAHSMDRQRANITKKSKPRKEFPVYATSKVYFENSETPAENSTTTESRTSNIESQLSELAAKAAASNLYEFKTRIYPNPFNRRADVMEQPSEGRGMFSSGGGGGGGGGGGSTSAADDMEDLEHYESVYIPVKSEPDGQTVFLGVSFPKYPVYQFGDRIEQQVR